MSRPAIIPRPVAMTVGTGVLPVTADTALLADRDSAAAARLLAAWLPDVGGQPRRARTLRSPAAPGSITLTTATTRTDLHDEGYALTVTPRYAVVTGAAPRGVLWGAQTLRQLLHPPAPPDAGESDAPAALPVVDIVDHPRFAWRGLHLDVARHFFPIEMPGHAQAALASYPELGCAGAGYEVATTWGIKGDVLCAGRDTTFSFLEEVLDEVLELFPGPFIHVGGDECPKQAWRGCHHCQQRIAAERLVGEDELQSWFIRRMAGWLADRGRRLLGWDEILEGGLAPGATVMSWRGSDGGVAAATAGHDVVMSPNTHCYFDYYQSRDTAAEPPAIGGHLPLEQVYAFEPVPPALAGHAAHVLGVQGNIWTEYMATESQVQYMAFPRALALAEVAWTPAELRSPDHFRHRLAAHRPLLDSLGVHYRPWAT